VIARDLLTVVVGSCVAGQLVIPLLPYVISRIPAPFRVLKFFYVSDKEFKEIFVEFLCALCAHMCVCVGWGCMCAA